MSDGGAGRLSSGDWGSSLVGGGEGVAVEVQHMVEREVQMQMFTCSSCVWTPTLQWKVKSEEERQHYLSNSAVLPMAPPTSHQVQLHVQVNNYDVLCCYNHLIMLAMLQFMCESGD